MQAIGEVLSSSISGFLAEAWRQDLSKDSTLESFAPSFGSFIKSKSEDKRISVIGVVYDIVTGSQDQHHKPTALRMSRAELKREQPQIFALLKTEWHVSTVAYIENGVARTGLPPFPPEVHDFVYPLEKEEVVEVTESLEFLRMLSNVTGSSSDELLAASIRAAARARHDDYNYLVDAGQHVSQLFREDFDRLASVLKRIRP